MFASTLYSRFKEEFKCGKVNPDEHYNKFIFIIPQTDRKDAHNLMKNSIALRIGQVPRDIIIKCNGGKEFDVSDINSSDVEVRKLARACIKNIMEYVNKCCNEGLKKNYLSRIPNSGEKNTGASGSAFSKSKKIKLTY